MPELPEVETVRAGLSRLIVGKTVAAVSHDTAKSFPNAQADVDEFLIASTITAVERRAKVLLVGLSSGYSLIIHLKMTGQLVYVGAIQGTRATIHGEATAERWGGGHPNDSLVHELPDKSTRATLTFSDDSQLFFNDQRKFGWMRLLPTAQIAELDFFKKVGPEPLADDFTWQQMKTRLLRRKKSAIKAVLLDQTVIAGVGNIYADESLWGAGIHPLTAVAELSDPDIQRLHSALRDVLQLSIDKGGSSNHTYVDAEGRKGSYMSFANVFRREGQACPRCGTVIIKTRAAGRGTHICPVCQRVPGA